jgi:hypothetical protein
MRSWTSLVSSPPILSILVSVTSPSPRGYQRCRGCSPSCLACCWSVTSCYCCFSVFSCCCCFFWSRLSYRWPACLSGCLSLGAWSWGGCPQVSSQVGASAGGCCGGVSYDLCAWSSSPTAYGCGRRCNFFIFYGACCICCAGCTFCRACGATCPHSLSASNATFALAPRRGGASGSFYAACSCPVARTFLLSLGASAVQESLHPSPPSGFVSFA